jgi:putative DNA primase/helicase
MAKDWAEAYVAGEDPLRGADEMWAREPERESPAFSEDALALRFSEAHADTLRYVALWNKWLRWNEVFWEQDTTLLAFDLVRDLCRRIASEANKGGKGLASNRTVAAVANLTRADRRHAATIEQWDANPWLLNTPDETIDLRTGQKRPHEPGDYITKCTAVSPSGGCPRWLAFLARVTGGDISLQTFLQRMLGCCLTGITRDHALFFLYGLGANGKSVLLNTVIGIMGEYHRTAPIEMLLASKHERHPTELAGLVGRRLVTATETEQGKRWAEAKIKALTGGDRISARFMCKDFFEFEPRFKLVVAGNHKPSLNTVDEAIRRRFHLVPFTVIIPKGERDPELTEKLKSERPGILQWMIEGCAQWQEKGLDTPGCVTSATSEYLASQDVVRNWLDECTEKAPQVETASSKLFASWKVWCEQNGEYVGSSKVLAQKLVDQGYRASHTRSGSVVRGLQVLG